MKILNEYIQDLLDTASILEEQANQLRELGAFFGMPSESRIKPEVKVEARLEVRPESKKTIKTKVLLPEVKETLKPVRVVTGGGAGARKLSEPEKEAIKQDWNALGESLRTKENRAALALKHSCSIIQIATLTRGEEYKQLLKEKKATSAH